MGPSCLPSSQLKEIWEDWPVKKKSILFVCVSVSVSVCLCFVLFVGVFYNFGEGCYGLFVSLVVGMVGSLGYPTPNPQDYSLQSITDTPNMI